MKALSRDWAVASLTLTLLILCAAAANAAMQFPRLEMLLLILFASSSLTATGRERGERGVESGAVLWLLGCVPDAI